MDSPVMVQNISSIPIRVQHTTNVNTQPEPMEVDSGFPFDENNFDRGDASFRSHLDDLAKRHPEIAQHFNRDFDKFPFRSNTWGHKRRGSKDEDRSSSIPTDDFPEFKRFTDRPFGSRFERFGFPFNRTFDSDPHFRQEFEQQNRPQQPQTSSNQQQTQPSTSPKEFQQQQPTPQENSEKPPQVPNQDRGRKQHPYVAQSNTTDLGQKREAVNENRGQRSMSAPPENRSNQQRYVSSINIPINVEKGGNDDMGSQHSQQQPQQQQQQNTQSHNQSSHERVIPIHVEGRDEPVIPRNVHSTFASPKPEPERIFTGPRPGHYGGWPRNEPHYYRGEPHFQHQTPPQHQKPTAHEEPAKQQQQQQQQQIPPQRQQQQVPPQRQQTPPKQEQEQQKPPQQPPQKTKLTPEEEIAAVQKDVAELMTKIEEFKGKEKDKQYLYLDEMLTRNLIKLDNIQTDGQDNLRQLRKEAIKSVQRCISILESKVSEKKQEPMEIEQKEDAKPTEEQSQSQTMELEKPQEQESEKTSAAEVKPEESQKVEQTATSESQNPSNEQNQGSEQQNSSQQSNQVPEEAKLTVLEVSGKARTGSEVKPNENKEQSPVPMDVSDNSNASVENAEKKEEKKLESGDAKEQKDENKEGKKEDKKEKKKVKKKEKKDEKK